MDALNKRKGLLRLIKESISIIAASVAAISPVKAAVTMEAGAINTNGTVDEHVRLFKKVPKLVLKLNASDIGRGSVVMHTSHRSHSSHSSHSSHYSSSSGYSSPRSSRSVSSSSSTYGVGYGTSSSSSSGTSSSTKSSSSSSATSKSKTSEKTSSGGTGAGNTYGAELSTSTSAIYLKRILYKGCEGDDVLTLQKLLVKLKLSIVSTGYFGDQTEQAVLKFQKTNELKPDGKVDNKVFMYIKKKADGIPD